MTNPCYKCKINSSFKMIKDDNWPYDISYSAIKNFQLIFRIPFIHEKRHCNLYKSEIVLLARKQFYLINLKYQLTFSIRGSNCIISNKVYLLKFDF